MSDGMQMSALADALDYLATAIAGPPTEPLPDLRQEWHRMSCRFGIGICACKFCCWDAVHRDIVANWEVAQSHRPHQNHLYPYGGLNAALSDVLYRHVDGHRMRSSAGSVAERGRTVSQLGAAVQITRRRGDPSELRRLDLAIDVDIAARQAARKVATTAAPTAFCLSVLYASVSEARKGWKVPGMSEAVLRGIEKRARRRLTIELAARDIIPMPRERARLGQEIETRRAEILFGVP